MVSFFVNCNIEFADLINIIGIGVNAVLAWWIVKEVQGKQSDERVLKDHFITEIKDLRSEYRNFLQSLSAGKLKPKEIISTFKLLNIKVNDVISLVREKCLEINESSLNPYQVELRGIVTELSEFVSSFDSNKKVVVSQVGLEKLIEFQQRNNNLFNQLIVSVNNCRSK